MGAGIGADAPEARDGSIAVPAEGVDLRALARALRRRQSWSHRGALMVAAVGGLAGLGLILEGAGLAHRDSFLRHASGAALFIGGVALYGACAFAATWVFYSFDPGLRLRRFAVVFATGIVGILLLALLQNLAELLRTDHPAQGGHAPSERSGPRRARTANVAAAVLDQGDASQVLGGMASAPSNSDTWWMPKVSIATCEARGGSPRLYLFVYPRERAPRSLLRRLAAAPAVEQIRDQLTATAGDEQWVVRATVRSDGRGGSAEDGLLALAQHALERLQAA